jgi:hypothetical protein
MKKVELLKNKKEESESASSNKEIQEVSLLLKYRTE